MGLYNRIVEAAAVTSQGVVAVVAEDCPNGSKWAHVLNSTPRAAVAKETTHGWTVRDVNVDGVVAAVVVVIVVAVVAPLAVAPPAAVVLDMIEGLIIRRDR